MKTKLLQAVGFLLILVGYLFPAGAFAQIGAPAIIAQPADQAVEYGANATFSVVAGGTSVEYRWRQNGIELLDYGNIAGAQSASLKLVGVAHDDAGTYSVVLSNAAGVITSAVATLTVNSVVVF